MAGSHLVCHLQTPQYSEEKMMNCDFLKTYFKTIYDFPTKHDVLSSQTGQYLMNLNLQYLDGHINYFDRVVKCYQTTTINELLEYKMAHNNKAVSSKVYDDHVLNKVSDFERAYRDSNGDVGLRSLGFNMLFILQSDDIFGLVHYSDEHRSCGFGMFVAPNSSSKIIEHIESDLTHMKDKCFLHDFNEIDSSIFKFLITY